MGGRVFSSLSIVVLAGTMVLGAPLVRAQSTSIAADKATTTTTLPSKVLLPVPFLSQAPFGNWKDPRQQNGCEEASLIMVEHWLDHTTVSKAQGLQEILSVTAWEKTHLGGYPSLSVVDMVRLARQYFHMTHITTKTAVSVGDIKTALAAGDVVIVPINGQGIHNPHYTAPGPAEHMLVIRGYDDARGIFITNDSGTRYGAGYTYPYATLEAALREYPTGPSYAPIPTTIKGMIRIGPTH